MGSRSKLMLGLVLLCLVGLGVFAYYHFREPRYEGVPESEWIRRAKSENVGERKQAYFALGEMRSSSEEALSALMYGLTDLHFPRDPVYEVLAGAIIKIGPPAIPPLLSIQVENDRTPRFPAESPESVRERALGLIAQMEADKTTPVLLRILKSQDSSYSYKERAVEALKMMGPKAKAALPELVAMLRDDKLQAWAITIIGAIGPDASEAVPHLHVILKKTPHLQYSVIEALGRIGPAAKEVIPTLIELLPVVDINTRRSAIKALGAMGPAAKGAVPALIDAFGTDNMISPVAAGALGKIGADAVPALMATLQHPSFSKRAYAIIALGEIGPAAKEAVPALSS